MTNEEWIRELIAEAPHWIRALISEALDLRDKRIAELEAEVSRLEEEVIIYRDF